MIKKLDILVIKAFIKPFLATLLIATFVLVMQTFWLYIDDLVGKGLDMLTVGKFIMFVAASVIPLALPLALLLSSIMTFGNLGESFELVAIKSAGISLIRFMRPLLILTILLSGVAFIFGNNIIPVVMLKKDKLMYDIIVTKPALNIKEGLFFNGIDNYSIKIGKKEKDNSTIHDVIIFEKNYGLQDYLLIAKNGKIQSTPDGRTLQFYLYDGWHYEESGNSYDNSNTQFIRMGFKEYKKSLDITSFLPKETPEESWKNAPKMMSVRQLSPHIDSMKKADLKLPDRLKINLSPSFAFVRYQSDKWCQPTTKITAKKYDSLFKNDSLRDVITDRAARQFINSKNMLQSFYNEYTAQQETLRKYQIEWHRKFTLSAACIILFLIGAPLGSIIRKGGLGMPMVFAIVFFVLFYILNTIGEKTAKQGSTSVFGGMWLSSAILLPIGIFLIAKAMRDSQLFNKEFYHRLGKNIRSLISRRGK
ncbi:MAG: LptF/LptG family permease [Chitinophagaceae bacterium]|jgi:lipopolysaccharide export system permease protein|nr:LptF/LptG family permease [Chitinophagaceae bacterium]